MSGSSESINPLFLQLVLSLQSAALFQMGKIVSPISGQIERDLTQAKISIDLLAMLQEKTRGNILDEEKQILDSTVYNLQMNYVDELDRDKNVSRGGTDQPAEKPSGPAQETGPTN